MPLKAMMLDAGHRDQIQRAVKAISPTGAFAALSPGRLHTAVPHPVYVMGLDKLAAGEGLATAELIGTRALLVQDGKPVAAAEVAVTRPGVAAVKASKAVASLNRGPFVEGQHLALEHAETLHEVRGGDYEVRLLRVPALYLEVLWLHGADGDMLIPIAPAPAEVTAGKTYTPDELVAALQPRAAQLARFDSSPRP